MLDQLENIVAAQESMLTESLGFTNGPDDNSSEMLETDIVLHGGPGLLTQTPCYCFLSHRNDKDRVEVEIFSFEIK